MSEHPLQDLIHVVGLIVCSLIYLCTQGNFFLQMPVVFQANSCWCEQDLPVSRVGMRTRFDSGCPSEVGNLKFGFCSSAVLAIH